MALNEVFTKRVDNSLTQLQSPSKTMLIERYYSGATQTPPEAPGTPREQTNEYSDWICFGQAQHLTHTFSITAQSAAASPSAPWRPAALGSREEAGRRGGAPAALDFTPRSRVHRAAGTRRTHLSLEHTHTCARSPHPPRAHRSYLRGSSGGGPTVSCFFSRRGPHCLQCRASRRLQSPADPSPGQLGFRALGCTPGLGRLQLLPPRVGVCPHLRGAQWAAAGAGAGARRLRRALGLLPGSGQPVQTRMALGLAAAPGRGLSPRAAPASVFVSRPAPPRHGLGGSEQRGQGSRRQRAGLGFSIIARPQRAVWETEGDRGPDGDWAPDHKDRSELSTQKPSSLHFSYGVPHRSTHFTS
ncbi:uncharacterized protein [Equus caballus]|uniref:uncharacterized protein n=1 Tax=Equus caballus TaxID=9796 RepID=UPI0038B2E799